MENVTILQDQWSVVMFHLLDDFRLDLGREQETPMNDIADVLALQALHISDPEDEVELADDGLPRYNNPVATQASVLMDDS